MDTKQETKQATEQPKSRYQLLLEQRAKQQLAPNKPDHDVTHEVAANKTRNNQPYKVLDTLLPNVADGVKLALSNVLGGVFYRAGDKDASYTPFKVTPKASLTYPQHVVDDLRKSGAVMPEVSEGDNMYSASGQVSLSAIADLSRISKGSLSGVNSHQQHLTVEGLERWRKALSKIGRANPTIEDVHALSQLGDPKVFLEVLLTQWSELISALPIARISEWALAHTDHDVDTLAILVESFRPTYKSYVRNMLTIWRTEYNEGKLETYADKRTLLDVLQTRTASRRISRGFHDMIQLVHGNMPAFNSRIKYSKSNYQEYKRRYSTDATETGLTAEVLMGYCFFLGINPIAMLQWLAHKEANAPSGWVRGYGHTPRDIIVWQGTISPVEYQRFYEAIHEMGLVSDQNLWAMGLYMTTCVYKNVPIAREVETALEADSVSLQSVVNKYANDISTMDFAMPKPTGGYDTLLAQAMACSDFPVSCAHLDVLAISMVSEGELLHKGKHQDVKDEANSRLLLDEEDYMNYVRSIYTPKSFRNPEKYVSLTVGDEEYDKLTQGYDQLVEKVRARELDVDHENSYKVAFEKNAAKYYYGFLVSLHKEEEEVSDNLSY